ncbi:hypothetical protein B0H17DRAFT_1195801 [Mycena rosella]|uniref:Uncharacterized protein n=1 Tax=Mycena rosella TaxID=1033263 RepID=A0AAD7GQN8_MYCRO|nr:hypothetical protein B0H17DRAFT_1195801 [Mycena rosella]
MFSEIALPSIGRWAQEHLTSVLLAMGAVAFNAAFDRLVAPAANITLNGEALSRDAYKDWLLAGNVPCASRDLTFLEVVEVPTYDIKAILQAGVVSLVYNATCGSTGVVSSLHLSINRVDDLCPTPVGHIHGDCDSRRVVDVNHISSNVTRTVKRFSGRLS